MIKTEQILELDNVKFNHITAATLFLQLGVVLKKSYKI